MTSEQLHTALYEKLSAELKAYQEQLMAMPPSEILKHTFEHTIKEDIVCVMEDAEFDDSYVRTLLRLRNPLNALYEEYRTRDTQQHGHSARLFRGRGKDRYQAGTGQAEKET